MRNQSIYNEHPSSPDFDLEVGLPLVGGADDDGDDVRVTLLVVPM